MFRLNSFEMSSMAKQAEIPEAQTSLAAVSEEFKENNTINCPHTDPKHRQTLLHETIIEVKSHDAMQNSSVKSEEP